jgi:hypothetical protein
MDARTICALLLISSGAGRAPDTARAKTPLERGSARYALLPLRNLSDDAQAPDALFARVRGELERRGASFVPQADLERELRSRRVRYTDSLSVADLRALSDATGADFVLAGTLIDYAPGLEPRVALALRALDTRTGARAGSSIVTLRGADFEGLLGLGRIDDERELSTLAIERLLSNFDEHALPHAVDPRPQLRERSSPPDGGWGFQSAEFDPRVVQRVAILPLGNRSRDLDAPAVFAELLGQAWYASSGIEVVEPGELRAALVSLRVRSMEFVDSALLAELGRRVGTRWFALGTVERFGEETPVGNLLFPEVEATIELFDVESGRVVATAGARRRGDRYQGLLGLGAVFNPLELAHRVAHELVAALGG